MSSRKSQQCGKSATHDGKFSYSLVVIIDGNYNIQLTEHNITLNAHRYGENCLKTGLQIAEIFQNREQNIEHVENSITAHRTRF